MNILHQSLQLGLLTVTILVGENSLAFAGDTRIEVEVTVREPSGRTVENCTVRLALPRYPAADNDKYVETSTDQFGKATLSGIAQQDYVIIVSKAGYYGSTSKHYDIDTPSSLRSNGVGKQRIDIELKAVKDPIIGISRSLERVRVPFSTKPVGFDLEAGDWVMPHGNGKIADFLFEFVGVFETKEAYDQTIRLTFSNAHDGAVPFRCPKHTGSTFKFPYEAPNSGYLPTLSWHVLRNRGDGHLRTTVDGSGETNYIYRVRTEVDEDGKIVRARYGVVMNDFFPVAGDGEVGRQISFTYAFNPHGTRNIEFDPEKTAVSPR
jgi:hypothetical protein